MVSGVNSVNNTNNVTKAQEKEEQKKQLKAAEEKALLAVDTAKKDAAAVGNDASQQALAAIKETIMKKSGGSTNALDGWTSVEEMNKIASQFGVQVTYDKENKNVMIGNIAVKDSNGDGALDAAEISVVGELKTFANTLKENGVNVKEPKTAAEAKDIEVKANEVTKAKTGKAFAQQEVANAKSKLYEFVKQKNLAENDLLKARFDKDDNKIFSARKKDSEAGTEKLSAQSILSEALAKLRKIEL